MDSQTFLELQHTCKTLNVRPDSSLTLTPLEKLNVGMKNPQKTTHTHIYTPALPVPDTADRVPPHWLQAHCELVLADRPAGPHTDTQWPTATLRSLSYRGPGCYSSLQISHSPSIVPVDTDRVNGPQIHKGEVGARGWLVSHGHINTCTHACLLAHTPTLTHTDIHTQTHTHTQCPWWS